jgi:hypothetical protein
MLLFQVILAERRLIQHKEICKEIQGMQKQLRSLLILKKFHLENFWIFFATTIRQRNRQNDVERNTAVKYFITTSRKRQQRTTLVVTAEGYLWEANCNEDFSVKIL